MSKNFCTQESNAFALSTGSQFLGVISTTDIHCPVSVCYKTNMVKAPQTKISSAMLTLKDLLRKQQKNNSKYSFELISE